jgi:hypothetical protein
MLRRILKILVREQLILALSDNAYVVTDSGRKASRSRILAKGRDVSRMFYLVERSKGGGVGL